MTLTEAVEINNTPIVKLSRHAPFKKVIRTRLFLRVQAIIDHRRRSWNLSNKEMEWFLRLQRHSLRIAAVLRSCGILAEALMALVALMALIALIAL